MSKPIRRIDYSKLNPDSNSALDNYLGSRPREGVKPSTEAEVDASRHRCQKILDELAGNSEKP